MRFTTSFWRIVKPIISFFKKTTFLPRKGLLCLHDKQNNRWSLADMELLFSCLSRYQEIITVYILLLDTLLVRCSRSRDNKLNIQREILYQSAPKYYSLFIEWVQNSRVCHTASIQNPLKVTIFNEFQCMTVARSLSDRFSHSPTIIDCWPQKWLLMNVKPSNLLISTPVNCISEHGQLRWEPITAEAIKNLFSVFTYSHLNTRWGWENLRKLRELDTQSRVCITLKTFPSLEYLTEKT